MPSAVNCQATARQPPRGTIEVDQLASPPIPDHGHVVRAWRAATHLRADDADMKTTMRRFYSRGLSLIELMVALTIAGRS